MPIERKAPTFQLINAGLLLSKLNSFKPDFIETQILGGPFSLLVRDDLCSYPPSHQLWHFGIFEAIQLGLKG